MHKDMYVFWLSEVKTQLEHYVYSKINLLKMKSLTQDCYILDVLGSLEVQTWLTAGQY